MLVSESLIVRLTYAILAVGLVWRIARYLLNFPIWGDEAMLANNVARYDYVGLMKKLDQCQVAPILFLWSERLAWEWLGSSMFAMRLAPMLAATFALIAFDRLAKRVCDPLSRLFAVGILSVSIWPVSMGAFIKPYSFDLLSSTVLLLLAAAWLARPESWIRGIGLIAAMPLCIAVSYPALFVAGSVSLVLLPRMFVIGQRNSRILYVAMISTMLVGAFVSIQIGKAQLNTSNEGISTSDGMANYWSDSFPPSHPLSFPSWLLLGLTGQMMAYPLGSANGGSILTTFWVAVGAVSMYRRNRTLFLLLVGPFLLGFAAAVLRRYPFFGSCRLLQYLAPSICLFAGEGIAACVRKWNSTPRKQRNAVLITIAAFAAIGIVGLIRDAVHPYRERGCEWLRQANRDVLQTIPEQESIVCPYSEANTESVAVWYFLNQPRPIHWNNEIPQTPFSRIWWYDCGPRNDAFLAEFERNLHKTTGKKWVVDFSHEWDFQESRKDEDLVYCRTVSFRVVEVSGR